MAVHHLAMGGNGPVEQQFRIIMISSEDSPSASRPNLPAILATHNKLRPVGGGRPINRSAAVFSAARAAAIMLAMSHRQFVRPESKLCARH
jgi:hypothetical protein